MKRCEAALLAAFSVCGLQMAWADSIQIVPATQSSTVGQSIVANIVASGFKSGLAPSIGAYDLTVAFNPAILSFVSASFGTGLDIVRLGSIQSVTHGIGTIEVFELSLDSIADLNTLQLDTFSLTAVTFQAIGSGASQLSLFANALSDASGNNLSATLEGAAVQVREQVPIAMPEPGSMLLCAIGITMLITILMWRHALKSRSARACKGDNS